MAVHMGLAWRQLTRWPRFAAVLVATGWLPNQSLAEVIYQQRSPVAIGCVVDIDPTPWPKEPGEAVESTPLIGHMDGVERMAVLEYDISDLVPGVVDNVRLTGRVGPGSTVDTGVREFQMYLAGDDGAVTVEDNIRWSWAGLGRVWQHTSGTTTDFDIRATAAFRTVMSYGPSFLRQTIEANADPQGWDEVVSDANSSPKLELEVRPTTSSTVVFYAPPHATGAATAQRTGSYTVDASALKADVTDTSTENKRAMIEYDLSSIPAGARVLWAKIDVNVRGFQYGVDRWPNLRLAGYEGDGSITAADATTAATFIGASDSISYLDAYSWDLDTAYVESILGSFGYLGVRMEPGDHPEMHVTIQFDAAWANGSAVPHLAIAYEIPEPDMLPLLLLAGAGLIRRR